MTDSAVLWPNLLGFSFLAVGIVTYRRDLMAAVSCGPLGLMVLGPAFIAAAMAAFAGEHFTNAAGLSTLVPKWMPARLFITYFVGVAEVCAALSLVARKCVRWSAFGLATMFALFVLLLYLPSAVTHPALRIVWIFPFREGTFAMAGVAMFTTAVRDQTPDISSKLATTVRFWTATALIFFGLQNVLYPQFAPGVPSNSPTSPWVPFPHAIAYATGILLIAFGAGALAKKYGPSMIASAGLLMTLLTLALYVPDYFRAHTTAEGVTALNFFFDTLLFAGSLFAIAHAQNDGA